MIHPACCISPPFRPVSDSANLVSHPTVWIDHSVTIGWTLGKPFANHSRTAHIFPFEMEDAFPRLVLPSGQKSVRLPIDGRHAYMLCILNVIIRFPCKFRKILYTLPNNNIDRAWPCQVRGWEIVFHSKCVIFPGLQKIGDDKYYNLYLISLCWSTGMGQNWVSQ